MQIIWWIGVLLAGLVGLYALAYVVVGPAMYPPHLAESFLARPWGIYPHAFFGAIAIVLGPFQFRRDLLRRNRPRHRALGTVYVASCLLAGTAGLYMSLYSFGGWPSHLGFASLAIVLLFATLRALRAARRRDIPEHREWMLRSYALIFAAVTLRLEVPLLYLALGPVVGYVVVAWCAGCRTSRWRSGICGGRGGGKRGWWGSWEGERGKRSVRRADRTDSVGASRQAVQLVGCREAIGQGMGQGTGASFLG